MKTNPLNVVSARNLALALMVSIAGLPAVGAVFDDFESYAVGSNLHGQGGWSGWAGNPGAGALVSTAFSFSPTRSVNVNGAGDLVHTFSGVINGQWVFKVMQYIPSTSSGTNYVILLNRYQPPFTTTELNWSVQFQNNMDTGQIISDLGGGASRPMVKNQWVEIRVEVNLASNTVAEYYNGQPLSTHVWQDGTGLNELQALDLFAADSGPVYYDNVNVAPAAPPATTLQLSFTAPSSFNEYTRQAVLEWNAEPGKTYLIQSADDLTPGTGWKTEEPVTATRTGPIRWMAPEAIQKQKYYRLILPHPEVFSVEPAFIDSSDPTALLYISGQCLPTNGTIVINGQNYIPTSVDPNGNWVAISLNGLPPGTPVIGTILVLDNASNIVATLPLQSPVLYGTELTMEQLQGPPDEPPASPECSWTKGGGASVGRAEWTKGGGASVGRSATWTKGGGASVGRSEGWTRGGGASVGRAEWTKGGGASVGKSAGWPKGGGASVGKPNLGHRSASWTKGGGASVGKPNPGRYVASGDEDDDDDGDWGDFINSQGNRGAVIQFDVVNAKTPVLRSGGSGPNGQGLRVSDGTGEVLLDEVDLAIPGRGLDFIWARSYRSRTGSNTAQGAGWDFSYNVSLAQQPDGTIVLHPGNGRADTFYSNGTNGWARDEYFVAIRDLNGDGMPDVLFADTGRWLFNPLGTPAGGKLWQIIDRNGNTMTLDYNLKGQLSTIVDDLGRTNIVTHNLAGQIASITDSDGRILRYEYDGNSDLTACVSPPVIGTPNGNDFPGGKTNRYTYSSGYLDDRENHLLLTVKDALGQIKYEHVYQHNQTDLEFLRCISVQRWTNPPTMFSYLPQTPAPSNQFTTLRCIVNDPLGEVTEYFYDGRNRCVKLQEFTGRATPGVPVTATVNRPAGKLRADDPDYFETRFEWNSDSLCTRVVCPRGDSTEMVYERAFNQNSARSNRAHAGDLRIVRELACCDQDDDGDGILDALTTTFEYDPRFGSCSTRGNGKIVCNYVRRDRSALADDGAIPVGNGVAINTKGTGADKGRFANGPRQTMSLDAEATSSDKFAQVRGFKVEITGFVVSSTDPRGLVTTDEYDTHGNRIVRKMIPVTQPDITGAQRDFGYNLYGQVTAITNAADGNGYRRVDAFSYYTNGPMAGYLEKVIVDVGGVVKSFRFSYDARGNVTQSVDPRGYDALYTYNALDQCVRVQSPTNLTSRCNTDFIYDAAGNVQDAIEELRDESDVFVRNVITHFEFDSLDRCTARMEQVSSGVFVTNRFSYDANNQLTLSESPLVVSGADPHSSVAFEYDERGLLFREIGAPGSGNSPTNEYHYTASGMRDRINELESKLIKLGLLTYDGFSRPISYTDPMSNVVSYVYDRNGNLTLVRCYGETNDVPGSAGNRLLSSAHYDYDSFNRLTRGRFEFFDITYLTAIGDGASTTTFAYAPNGDCTSVTDDNGHTTSYAYDTAGRLTSVTDPKTNIASFTYDECDNVLSVTRSDRSDLTPGVQQFSVIHTYDKLHRLTRSVDNVGNTNRYAYDSLDNLISAVDARDNETVYACDDLGRCGQTTCYQGLGRGITINTSHVEYDVNSRCISATDANSNETFYAYDSLDRHVATTNADGTTQKLIWSPRSNLVRTEDANGTVISNSFDLLDRCVRRDIAPGSGVAATTTFETFAYDGLSQLVAATNDASVCTFAYDSLGNCVRGVSGGLGAVVGSFDGVGNRLSMTYPSGRLVTCTYNAVDEVASVGSGSGGLPPTTLATFDYEGPGRIGRVSRANNVNTRVQWSGLVNPPNAAGDFGWGQVKGVNHQIAGGGAVIDQRRATYDQAQNKTLRAQTTPFYQGGDTTTNIFEYDPLDRLSRAINTTGTGATVRLYVLDGNGNRQLVVSNGIAEPYLMDATIPPGDFQMNQYTLTPFGAQSYDESGNLVVRAGAGGPTFYQYDYAGRLVEVAALTGGGMIGPVASYTYDALGRRISKTTYPPSPLAPVTTQFVYDNDDEDCDGILEEYVGGILSSAYVCDGGNARYTGDSHICTAARRIARIHGGLTYFYHADDLGNVLALTDASGAVVERYDFDEFGLPQFLTSDGFPMATNVSPAGNPFLFHGMEWDAETSLHHSGGMSGENPFYDPKTGRLINDGMPNRISMNVTVPRQTQGTTFGEKVNQGLHAAGGTLAGKLIVPVAMDKGLRFGGDGGGGGGCGGFMLKKEEGGRHTPFHNKYRPQFRMFSSISNVLKTKHDTAKNSIGNIR